MPDKGSPARQTRTALATSDAAAQLAAHINRLLIVTAMAGTLAGPSGPKPRWVRDLHGIRARLASCATNFAQEAGRLGVSLEETMAALRGLPSSPTHLPLDWRNAAEALVTLAYASLAAAVPPSSEA